MISDDLRQRRLALIREHMDTEVTQEFDATLATFKRPAWRRTPEWASVSMCSRMSARRRCRGSSLIMTAP